ncbi:MAG: hypothetical protein HZB25_07095 [Candidatus Eisenbacteria bacterium]|nr:hypothetical protein [Candidatus Eisenbacteria bacterium]
MRRMPDRSGRPAIARAGLRTRLSVCMLAVLLLPALAGIARADRRYFLYSYTPYRPPAGTLELETWLTAKTGKQDSTQHTQWDPRVEFEYGITHRLTASAYLNFSQPPGEALRFKAPSLELIYSLAEPGRLPGDPAVYFEVTETGDEIELEPKLLLAHRAGHILAAFNAAGEFEYRHDAEELLESGEVLRNEFKLSLSGGIAFDVNSHVALGLEARYVAEYPNFGAKSASMFSAGPCLNLQSEKVQLSLAVMPQISGSPRSSGHRNLVDFERTQVRAILGVDL